MTRLRLGWSPQASSRFKRRDGWSHARVGSAPHTGGGDMDFCLPQRIIPNTRPSFKSSVTLYISLHLVDTQLPHL